MSQNVVSCAGRSDCRSHCRPPPFGLAIVDTRGIISWANSAYAQLSGCTPAELHGRSAGEYSWDALAHTAPGGLSRGETVRARKNAEVSCIAPCITPLHSASGTLTGFWIMKGAFSDFKKDPSAMFCRGRYVCPDREH